MAPEKGIFWARAFENANRIFVNSSSEIIAFAEKIPVQGPRIIVSGKVFLIWKVRLFFTLLSFCKSFFFKKKLVFVWSSFALNFLSDPREASAFVCDFWLRWFGAAWGRRRQVVGVSNIQVDSGARGSECGGAETPVSGKHKGNLAWQPGSGSYTYPSCELSLRSCLDRCAASPNH